MADTPFNPETFEVNPTALEGMTVVITGKLTQIDRKQAEALVERAGGKATGSISSKTNLLVAGEKAGSKLQKAEQLGIEVLDEEAFISRIEKEEKSTENIPIIKLPDGSNYHKFLEAEGNQEGRGLEEICMKVHIEIERIILEDKNLSRFIINNADLDIQNWLDEYLNNQGLYEKFLYKDIFELYKEEGGAEGFRPTNFVDEEENEDLYMDAWEAEQAVQTIEDKAILSLGIVAAKLGIDNSIISNHFNNSDWSDAFDYNKRWFNSPEDWDYESREKKINLIKSEIKTKRKKIIEKLDSIITPFRSPGEDKYLIKIYYTFNTEENNVDSQFIKGIVKRKDLEDFASCLTKEAETSNFKDIEFNRLHNLGMQVKEDKSISNKNFKGKIKSISSIEIYLNDYFLPIDISNYVSTPIAYWKRIQSEADRKFETFSQDIYRPKGEGFTKLSMFIDSFYELNTHIYAILGWYPISPQKVIGEELIYQLLYSFYHHKEYLRGCMELSAVFGYSWNDKMHKAIESAFNGMKNPRKPLEYFIGYEYEVGREEELNYYKEMTEEEKLIRQVFDCYNATLGEKGCIPSLLETIRSKDN